MSDSRNAYQATLLGILALGVVGIMAACSKAPLPTVKGAADTIQCVPRGLGAQGLDAEWQAFAAHIQACVVIAPDGTPALEIITISAPSYYQSLSESARVKLPRPLLLLPGGRVAARLLYNYPDDPPLTTRLVFEAWERDIPQRIRTYVSRSNASGTYELTPLVWDAASRSYQGGDEPAR